jgi:hypothetical protein
MLRDSTLPLHFSKSLHFWDFDGHAREIHVTDRLKGSTGDPQMTACLLKQMSPGEDFR